MTAVLHLPSIASLALAAMPLALLSCGDTSKTTRPMARAPEGMRSEVLDHERCDDKGSHVEALDTNGDGKPDIRRVFDGTPGEKGSRELCRVVDLNHDGRPDLYEYLESSGTIRRREFCYDDTGVVNAIELYQGGKLAQRLYDTTGQHRIDTWDWFDPSAPVDAKTGRPAHPSRRERDLHGDGKINQWWTWNGEKLSIATDRNGDGKPDPDSVIVFGGDAGAPAPPALGASSAATDAGVSTPSAADADGGVGLDGAKS